MRIMLVLENCGSGDAWVCQVIDTNGNVGGYTSFLAPRLLR